MLPFGMGCRIVLQGTVTYSHLLAWRLGLRGMVQHRGEFHDICHYTTIYLAEFLIAFQESVCVMSETSVVLAQTPEYQILRIPSLSCPPNGLQIDEALTCLVSSCRVRVSSSRMLTTVNLLKALPSLEQPLLDTL